MSDSEETELNQMTSFQGAHSPGEETDMGPKQTLGHRANAREEGASPEERNLPSNPELTN